MKTIVLASLLLLGAATASATTQNFDIFFVDFVAGGPPSLTEGTYTLTDGVLTSFNAQVGCSLLVPAFGIVSCTFHNIAIPGDPLTDSAVILTDFYPGTAAQSELTLFQGLRPLCTI